MGTTTTVGQLVPGDTIQVSGLAFLVDRVQPAARAGSVLVELVRVKADGGLGRRSVRTLSVAASVAVWHRD